MSPPLVVSEAGLQWKERADGAWIAYSAGGMYQVTHSNAGGFHVWWLPSDQGGLSDDLGSHVTLGAAFGAARRFDPSTKQMAAEDCSHAHPPAVPTLPCPPVGAAPKASSSSVAALAKTLADPRAGGLVFVPTLYAALLSEGMSEVQARAAILKADSRGEIQLRPEGGINRLTPRERDLSIPGPQGTILSWASIRSSSKEEAGEKAPVIYETAKPLTKKRRAELQRTARESVKSMSDEELLSRTGAHEAREVAVFSTSTRDLEETRKARDLGPMHDHLAVYELLHPQLSRETQECFLVLPLDLHGYLLTPPKEVARGRRDSVLVETTDVLAVPIKANAKGFIIVHGHPSGIALPSEADLALTETIRKRAKSACPDIVLVDHVIIGDRQYYSVANKKLYHAQ